MKINSAMMGILVGTSFEMKINLNLNLIAESGFEIKDDCYFISELLPMSKSVGRENFSDCTGYECFVNSVHVEDYDEDFPLCQSVKFTAMVFERWRAITGDLTLISIICADDCSVVVKFHVKRKNENWVGGNIDEYKDPIMIFESSEDVIGIASEFGGN